MNSKNGYFTIDYTTSARKFTFSNIPEKYVNHAFHYVLENKRVKYFATENILKNYWYTRVDLIPIEFDIIKLYAFDIDSGVELIDEYEFDINHFNFILNLKTNNVDESTIWMKYIDLYNKSKNTKLKYALNITEYNQNFDNYEISREKYNSSYSFYEPYIDKIPSIDIIKKILGDI